MLSYNVFHTTIYYDNNKLYAKMPSFLCTPTCTYGRWPHMYMYYFLYVCDKDKFQISGTVVPRVIKF